MSHTPSRTPIPIHTPSPTPTQSRHTLHRTPSLPSKNQNGELRYAQQSGGSNSIKTRVPYAQHSETLARATICAIAHGPDAFSFALVYATHSAVLILALILRSVLPAVPAWLATAIREQKSTYTSKHHNAPYTAITQELWNAHIDVVFPANDTLLEKALIAGCSSWGRSLHAEHMDRWRTMLQQWRNHATTIPFDTIDALEEYLTDHGKYWIIDPSHPFWPEQCNDLMQRTDALPPLCLWGEGDVQALSCCSKPIAIVGSRVATHAGKQTAYDLAAYAARRGHTVVSGGALGIDASAHYGSLVADSKGRTIVVIAGGLRHAGPIRNRPLFDDIIAHHGLLISEMAPDELPLPHRFLLRNRLIAALASTVIVVQAQARSGALNTATWAAELQRHVLAIPGPITTPHHYGCHMLIYQEKASILPDISALDDWLHAAHTTSALSAETIHKQQLVWQVLQQTACNHTKAFTLGQYIALCSTHLEQQGVSTTIPELTAILGLLESQHLIERDPQGQYHICHTPTTSSYDS